MHPPSPALKIVVALVLLAAAALPFAALPNLPLVDQPNHAARMAILAALPHDADLARFYVEKPGFRPYLAMPLVVWPLAPLIGVEAATRVFAILAVLMPGLGTLALARAIHGRVPWPALGGAALAFGMVTAWGFLTFAFGLGVTLMVLAAWVAADGMRPWARAALFAPVVVGVGALHLLAAAVLVVGMGAREFARATAPPGVGAAGLVRALAPLLLPAAALVLLRAMVTPDDLGSTAAEFGSWDERLLGFVSPLTMGLDAIELAVGLAVALPVAIALALRLVRIGPVEARFVLWIALGAAVTPFALQGVYFLHLRLPLLAAAVLLAALDDAPSRLRPRAAAALAGAFVGLAGLHALTCWQALAPEDARIAALRDAAAVSIPRGSRILPAIDPDGPLLRGLSGPKPVLHAASLLAADRSAFLPTLFGMYELDAAPAYRGLFPRQAPPVSTALLDPDRAADRPAYGDPADYDVVVAFDARPGRPWPPGLTLRAAGDGFAILAVDHPRPPLL